MFEIKMTVNGKPVSEASFRDELEKMVFNGVVESATNAVKCTLNSDESSQITINVVGTDIEKLSLDIQGPEEIVAKVKQALSD